MPAVAIKAPSLVVQEIYEAFGRGDVAAILERCAETLLWKANAVAGEGPWIMQIERRQDLPHYFQTVAEHFSYTTFEPVSIVAQGDTVVVRLNIVMDVKRTGRTVVMEEIHWWTVNDRGQVASFTCFHDSSQVVKAWLA